MFDDDYIRYQRQQDTRYCCGCLLTILVWFLFWLLDSIN